MFFEINKSLCDSFTGLDPIKLLDYPAEDVFNLINDMISFNKRNNKKDKKNNNTVIRRPASDNWF
jgi:hypothetical protein